MYDWACRKRGKTRCDADSMKTNLVGSPEDAAARRLALVLGASEASSMGPVGRAEGVAGIVSRNTDRFVPLGADFVPGEYTVLCGKGKVCATATGNHHLRRLVQDKLHEYSLAISKVEKSVIVSDVMKSLQRHETGIFAKFDRGQWWAVDDAFAREKVRQYESGAGGSKN